MGSTKPPVHALIKLPNSIKLLITKGVLSKLKPKMNIRETKSIYHKTQVLWLRKKGKPSPA